MKAAILRNTGDNVLEYREDVEALGPGPGEVRVKIHATGLCHSDISAMSGIVPQPTPAVLGHEGAGEIIATGEGVTGINVGDHVIVAWNAPCGTCKACARGEYHLCLQILFGKGLTPHFSVEGQPIFGFAGNGTFAEEVVLPAESVVVIDKDVPYDVASLIGCGVMTGVGAAINTAKITPGSNVAVLGLGGVGIAAIQGARVAGAAEIVAIDLVDSKLEEAEKFGATKVAKPSDARNVIDQITANEGVDYAIECIGLPDTIRQSYELVRRGGTAVVVGAGKSDAFVQFNCWELFFNEKKLLGCYYGSANVKTDFNRLINLYKTGRLDLEGMISKRMHLSEINQAIENVKVGSVIRQVFTF